MATVIDVTQTAHEMVRLCQDVTESGLLEQVREAIAVADPYLRRGQQAVRDQQPPAEHARPPVAGIGDAARDVGRQLDEHRTLMQAAARDASEMKAYVTELEHLFRRLAA
jgi:hypothetical protein